MRKITALLVLSFSAVIAIQAKATQIIASPTGIASPATTITFDEIVLAMNSTVTTQYAGLGVSFSPFSYYSPQTGFGNVQGNDVGNFSFPTQPGFVNPLTLLFTSTQTAAAFSMDGDGTPYTFTALLNGAPVDAFTTTVGVSSSDFYGFSGEAFNAISITQAGAGGGPYYLIDNVELSPSAVPEPSSIVFLGTGLIGLVGAAKRRLS